MKVLVDLLDDVRVLHDKLQADHVSGRVHVLVGSGASHKRSLSRVVGVGFRDGAGFDKCLEELALDRLLRRGDLHALEASSRVADHDSDLALRLASFRIDFLFRECSRVVRLFTSIATLLVCGGFGAFVWIRAASVSQ